MPLSAETRQTLYRFLSGSPLAEAIPEPKRPETTTASLGIRPEGGVRNILAVLNAATEEEKEYWGRWYHLAHRDVEELATETGFPFRGVAAIVATLSPGNKWHPNLTAARRFLNLYRTEVLASRAQALLATGHPALGHSRAFRIGAYPRQVQKAHEIMQTGDLSSFWIGDRVTGPKVSVFYWSLVYPSRLEDQMVLDGHAINIWRGEKASLKGLRNPSRTEREQMLADYKAAANRAGLPVQAVQAITWYIWKYTTDPLPGPTGRVDMQPRRGPLAPRYREEPLGFGRSEPEAARAHSPEPPLAPSWQRSEERMRSLRQSLVEIAMPIRTPRLSDFEHEAERNRPRLGALRPNAIPYLRKLLTSLTSIANLIYTAALHGDERALHKPIQEFVDDFGLLAQHLVPEDIGSLGERLEAELAQMADAVREPPSTEDENVLPRAEELLDVLRTAQAGGTGDNLLNAIRVWEQFTRVVAAAYMGPAIDSMIYFEVFDTAREILGSLRAIRRELSA